MNRALTIKNTINKIQTKGRHIKQVSLLINSGFIVFTDKLTPAGESLWEFYFAELKLPKFSQASPYSSCRERHGQGGRNSVVSLRGRCALI